MRNRNVRIFYGLIILVFLVGGSLQLLGVLSNTVSTLLVGSLLFFVSFFQRKQIKINLLPFFYLSGVIILSATINYTDNKLLLLYLFSFVIVPFSIYSFIGNGIIGKIDLDKLYTLFLKIGLIQLPVLLLQQFFAEYMVALSVRTLSSADVAFGTLYLANDHGLGFFLISLIIFLLFNKTTIAPTKKTFIIVWLCITVVAANSNISILLLLVTLAFYFLPRLNIKLILSTLIGLILILLVVFSIPSVSETVGTKYRFLERKVFEDEADLHTMQERLEKGIPDRSDIILYYKMQDTKIIGEGPYDYFDPLSGIFNKFKNYSQYLWFYNDIGVLGLLSVFFIYISLFVKNCKIKSYKILYLFLILSYSFFTNTLSDLSFNIVFSIMILHNSPQFFKHKTKRNYEHSLRTISRLA